MTTSRYEVWASDTGEASHWKPVRGGVYESFPAAVQHARGALDGNTHTIVEQWNAGTNTFVATVWCSKTDI